jgi:hypothetical protein
MTESKQLGEMLKKPFEDDELIYQVDTSSVTEESPGQFIALEVPEVAIGAAYERLDDVFGIDGWEMFVDPLIDGGSTTGFRCQIRAFFPSSRVITKTGVGVSDKGEVTEALKKAFLSSVRLFGVGRYLDLIEPEWIAVDKNGEPLDGEIPPQEDLAAERVLAAAPRTSQDELEEDIPIGLGEPQGCSDPIPFPEPQKPEHPRSETVVNGPGTTRKRRNLPSPPRTTGYRSNAR